MESQKKHSQEGIVPLIKSTYAYIYQQSPFHSHVYQNKRQEATEARWDLIEPNISKDDASLLDIGCNVGLFCKWAAERGIHSFGIDRFANEETRNAAIETMRENENVAIMQTTLTPENIDNFPTFDVVLLLSVYHHWYSEFGEENARNMLRSFNDTEKIFFEPPSESERYVDVNAPYIKTPHDTADVPDFENRNRESIIKYHTDLLMSIFGDTHDVEMIGCSERLDVDRYLFLVERKE